MKRNLRIGIVCASLLAFGGCSTVKNRIADIDFIKLPEFREDAENIGNYPAMADVPQAPGDVRSDAAWDDSVRALMAKRDGFNVPTDSAPMLSEIEFNRKIKELSDKVEEYKRDDPQ